jgi:hypothetical protein
MNIVLFLHSNLRWAILILAVLVLVKAFNGIGQKSPFEESDRKVGLFFMISCDIQLLLGLILYFSNGWFSSLTSNTAEVMKTAATRYFAIEHLSVMLVAWVLVHVGYAKIKKGVGAVETHKTSLIFFGIALILMLSRIPFTGRDLFRGL